MTNKRLLATALLLAMLLATMLVPTVAFADINIGNGASYDTDVLTDLQRDSKFNIADYSVNENDYSLQVIALALNNQNDIYVYVYSPALSLELTATSINVAVEDYQNYELEFLNRNGVFSKYRIDYYFGLDDLTVEVSSIFRAWNEDLDEDTGNDNTINEVSFPVGKAWTFVDGVVSKLEDVELINVVSKYVGYVRYPSGFKFHVTDDCDAHFVAFSTDKPIDKLLEARIYFEYRTASYLNNLPYSENYSYGEIQKETVTIDFEDNATYSGSGLFSSTYTWDRIQTTEEFVNDVEYDYDIYNGFMFDVVQSSSIKDTVRTELADTEWVVRFYETSRSMTTNVGTGSYIRYWSEVSNVSLLRLKFETDGVVYNLGVVDNKQTGSGNPVNDLTTKVEATDLLQIVLGLVMLILIAVVGMPVLKAIFTVVFLLLKIVWKGVVLIISLPINLIKLLFGGGK